MRLSTLLNICKPPDNAVYSILKRFGVDRYRYRWTITTPIQNPIGDCYGRLVFEMGSLPLHLLIRRILRGYTCMYKNA